MQESRNMHSFWRKSREFLVPVGMAGLFASLFYFGVFRMLNENHEKMVAIQQAIVDRKILEEQTNGISGMRDEVDRIRSSSEKLEVFLTKDQVVSGVESIESIGRDMGVSIVSEVSSSKSLAALPAKKKPSTATAGTDTPEGVDSKKSDKSKDMITSLLPEERSVFITFKVTGEYANVLAFLRKIDTMPILLDVLSVGIEPASIDESEGGVSIRSVSESSRSLFASGNPLSEPDSSQKKSTNVTASFDTVLYTTP